MPVILVTNDDGVHSPGLLALKRALAPIGEVIVLAPERNWSASSHAKTMHKPLRIRPTMLADGSDAYSSSGSPTDCVALAAGGVLDKKPDLVVSGINNGHNLGVDVTYSGTVACAMEATIKGIPGIAVSTAFTADVPAEIDAVHRIAAQITCGITRRVLAHGLPPGTLLNVNVPGVAPEPLQGIRVTRMGGRSYLPSELVERRDPHGQLYYWLGGSGPIDTLENGSDVSAVKNGYVSVTPITLDMTAYAFLDELSQWKFEIGGS